MVIAKIGRMALHFGVLGCHDFSPTDSSRVLLEVAEGRSVRCVVMFLMADLSCIDHQGATLDSSLSQVVTSVSRGSR